MFQPLGIVRQGEKPSEELQTDLDLAQTRIQDARQQLIQNTDFLIAIQKRCPHNTIHYDINTLDNHCSDCHAELEVLGEGDNLTVTWRGPGVKYKIDTLFWHR